MCRRCKEGGEGGRGVLSSNFVHQMCHQGGRGRGEWGGGRGGEGGLGGKGGGGKGGGGGS